MLAPEMIVYGLHAITAAFTLGWLIYFIARVQFSLIETFIIRPPVLAGVLLALSHAVTPFVPELGFLKYVPVPMAFAAMTLGLLIEPLAIDLLATFYYILGTACIVITLGEGYMAKDFANGFTGILIGSAIAIMFLVHLAEDYPEDFSDDDDDIYYFIDSETDEDEKETEEKEDEDSTQEQEQPAQEE